MMDLIGFYQHSQCAIIEGNPVTLPLPDQLVIVVPGFTMEGTCLLHQGITGYSLVDRFVLNSIGWKVNHNLATLGCN